jgi:hypothetical protein
LKKIIDGDKTVTTNRLKLNRECHRRGINPVAIGALAIAVTTCTAYIFKRSFRGTRQYEIIMPGDPPPKMNKWLDVKIIRNK